MTEEGAHEVLDKSDIRTLNSSVLLEIISALTEGDYSIKRCYYATSYQGDFEDAEVDASEVLDSDRPFGEEIVHGWKTQIYDQPEYFYSDYRECLQDTIIMAE